MSSFQERRDVGVLNPATLPARFWREDPDETIAGLVRWWWLAEWDLPEGQILPQPVLAFPASNLTIERDRVALSGPTTRATTKELIGRGWVIGALLQPAVIPVLTQEPKAIVDQQMVLDEPELLHIILDCVQGGGLTAAIPLISHWLEHLAGDLSQEALLANQMNSVIETDPTITTVAQAADALALSVRTLHRLCAKYVGHTPYEIIQRRRIQDAAFHIRTNPETTLTETAHRFGFSDLAHFSKTFTQTVGSTPSAYRKSLTVK